MQAKISEIFLSFQGEGPFTGRRQLFIRFYGCNLNCVYCDTPLESFKSFSQESLFDKVLDFDDDYNELAVTGGEPLLYSEFLKRFLPLFKKHCQHKVYLETNGTMPEELADIIDYIDVIAMDIKLPSSTGSREGMWTLHKKFIDLAKGKELVVKLIITGETKIEDIKKAAYIIGSLKKDFTVVLQPATPINDMVDDPDDEMTSYFKEYIKKETSKDVLVMGQVHRCLGIK